MMNKCKRTKGFVYLIILFILIGSNLIAQENTELLQQTKIGFAFNSDKSYSQNFSISYRSFVYQEGLNYINRHLQLAHFSTFRLGNGFKVSSGIFYRSLSVFDDQIDDEIRLTQQFNYVYKNSALRFGHRLRIEERFRGRRITTRLRYRFAIDFPFQGQKVDIDEWYGIVTSETVNSFESSRSPRFDNRWTFGIGKLLHKDLKIQLLLHYRNNDFFANQQNRFFTMFELHFSP